MVTLKTLYSKKGKRYLCGITSFELPEDSPVELIHIDLNIQKYLLKFDINLIDWYSISWVEENFYEK